MKLITKEIAKTLPALYSTEEEDDPLVFVKLFHTMSSYTAFITEYDPVDKLAFGYVTGLAEDELGYFLISELEELEINGVGIERDLYFKPQRLSEIKREIASQKS